LKIETDGYISDVLQECIQALRKSYPEVRHIGAANVYAAWIGIDSVDACAAYYDNLGSFDTGFLATDILMDLLFKNNYENVAYKLLESRKEGSFLYMKDNGSTTVWEWWKGGGQSLSHPMFGASCRQLFEGVLGIRQCDGSMAYSKVIISPSLPNGMTYARGSILTPKGRISVSLHREEKNVSCDLIIPENIECVIEKKDGYHYLTSVTIE
jgi:alpha-L-rhamnosidase